MTVKRIPKSYVLQGLSIPESTGALSRGTESEYKLVNVVKFMVFVNMLEYKKPSVIYGEQNFSVPSHMNYGKFALENLVRGNEKVALINGLTDDKVTYITMSQQIVNVAAYLTRLGVKSGDVVGICSENRTEFLIVAIAVFCTGATATFINSAYNTNEVIHTTQISKPKIMFLSPNTYASFYDVLKNMNIINKFFIFGETSDINLIRYQNVVEENVEFDTYKPPDFKEVVHTALILYSSGTTGLPKGVKLTHRNLIISGLQPPRDNAKLKILTLAPWCNTIGIIMMLIRLQRNQTVIYLNRFQEDVYLNCIQKFKVGLLMTVPPLIVLLTKSEIIKNYDVRSIQLMHCGGAPLDKSVIIEAKQKFPNLITVLQGYGMTETTGALTEETESNFKIGSVGQVVPGNILKVVDVETRNLLGPHQAGEVCVKGPVLFEGYIGKNIKDDLDDEGFYKTGDIAYYDNDGYFYIVDRIKELIKYKAWQVAPSELEGILLQHEAVKDAGIIGTPDPVAGELPTAFVVVKPGFKVKEEELISYVDSKVSSWKKLRGGVIFVNEIPKTGSGKILRRVLKNLLNKPINSKL